MDENDVQLNAASHEAQPPPSAIDSAAVADVNTSNINENVQQKYNSPSDMMQHSNNDLNLTEQSETAHTSVGADLSTPIELDLREDDGSPDAVLNRVAENCEVKESVDTSQDLNNLNLSERGHHGILSRGFRLSLDYSWSDSWTTPSKLSRR